MTEPQQADSELFVDLYTRNGFCGPAATVLRQHYAPPYARVHGSYAPRRLDLTALPESLFDSAGDLPVPVLTGEGVSIELAHRSRSSAAAVRNVLADEIHYILEGSAYLETDFGKFAVAAGDFVLVPRAVTYRYCDVTSAVREIVIVTSSRMVLDPQPPVALNVEQHVHAPTPDPTPREDSEHRVIIRHGDDLTTYFFDDDPLPCTSAEGAPIVRRFSFADVPVLNFEQTGPFPPKLFDDATTNVLLFNLSNRVSPRPPVHHNADYDELIFYVAGPGHYGQVDKPGTIMWTPKGIVHHGPAEDVPAGYRAFLVETRTPLRLTGAGEAIAVLMETGLFGVFDN